MKIAYNTTVQHENTDCYGIANHSAYIKWMEAGRNEFFEQFGIKFKMLNTMKLKVLVAEMNCKYKKPVFLMDEITVTTTIKDLKRHKITFEQTITKMNDENILFSGTSTVIISDENNKLVSKIPEYIYDK